MKGVDEPIDNAEKSLIVNESGAFQATPSVTDHDKEDADATRTVDPVLPGDRGRRRKGRQIRNCLFLN